MINSLVQDEFSQGEPSAPLEYSWAHSENSKKQEQENTEDTNDSEPLFEYVNAILESNEVEKGNTNVEKAPQLELKPSSPTLKYAFLGEATKIFWS